MTPVCSVPIKTTATFNIQLILSDTTSETTATSSEPQVEPTSSGETVKSPDDVGDGVLSGSVGEAAPSRCNGLNVRDGEEENESDGEAFTFNDNCTDGVPAEESYSSQVTDDTFGEHSADRRTSNTSTDSTEMTTTRASVSDSVTDSGVGISSVEDSKTGEGAFSVGTSPVDDAKSGDSASDSALRGRDNCSSFNFIGWDLGNVVEQPPAACQRVLLWKDSYIALMFKVSLLVGTS